MENQPTAPMGANTAAPTPAAPNPAANNGAASDAAEQQGSPRSFGPLIGILVIVALLAFGGLYFWGASLQDAGAGFTSESGSSFEVIDTTIEEYTMTDEEFDALINAGADAASPATSAASDAGDAALDAALDDLSDLDGLDADLEALELEL